MDTKSPGKKLRVCIKSRRKNLHRERKYYDRKRTRNNKKHANS